MQNGEQDFLVDVQPENKETWKEKTKESCALALPHIKEVIEKLKVGAGYVYKGSEWCGRNIVPPLYKSLVCVLKHWVEFVKNGGEFSWNKKSDEKPNQKIEIQKNNKMYLPLSEHENLYILEVAKMLVKGETLSFQTRKKALALLRKVLKYEQGDLEDLLVSYFAKILKQ